MKRSFEPKIGSTFKSSVVQHCLVMYVHLFYTVKLGHMSLDSNYTSLTSKSHLYIQINEIADLIFLMNEFLNELSMQAYKSDAIYLIIKFSNHKI